MSTLTTVFLCGLAFMAGMGIYTAVYERAGTSPDEPEPEQPGRLKKGQYDVLECRKIDGGFMSQAYHIKLRDWQGVISEYRGDDISPLRWLHYPSGERVSDWVGMGKFLQSITQQEKWGTLNLVEEEP
jgi:uncharacterized protein RhaS with RHS repeats